MSKDERKPEPGSSAGLPPQLPREPRTAAEWAAEAGPDDAALTVPADALRAAARSASTIGEVERSAAFLTTSDLAVLEPAVDDWEFRDLRDRLFGDELVQRQPASFGREPSTAPEQVEIPAARTSSPVLPDLFPTEATTAVDPSEDSSVEVDADPHPEPSADDDGPDRVLDWATVAPQYAPQTEEGGGRGRILALVALVVVIAAVGAWLMFGPSAPHTGASARTQSGTTVITGAAPGLDSTVSFQHGSTITVQQDIVLRDAVTSITLTVPDRSGNPSLAAFDPRIKAVTVTASDGAAVPFSQSPFGVGESRTVSFAEPTRAFTISYRASSSVVSHPPSPGRGFLLATPLTFSDTTKMGRTVEVAGARILNLGCVRGDRPPIECGEQDNLSWSVSQQLGLKTSDVVAQIDLPPTD